MSDREDLGFKGPVHELALEKPGATIERSTWLFDTTGRLLRYAERNKDGTEYVTDYRYDDQGRRIEPAQPTRISTAADGSGTEIGEIGPGAEGIAWHRFKQLRGAFGFAGVREATRVLTSFDPRGIPAEVIFFNQQDEVLTRAIFETDKRGNIARAAFYGGAQPPLKLSKIYPRLTSASNKEVLLPLVEADALQSEVSFEYDAAGNLIGKEYLIAGISRGKSRYTYNAQGDMMMAEENDAPPVRFEYTYDSCGNWIRQTVHHAGGSDESHRIITYYED
jgi:YD repeat-containing protein